MCDSIILVNYKPKQVILSSQKVLDKGPEYEDMVPWLGYGLVISTGIYNNCLCNVINFRFVNLFKLTQTGDKWRSRRKLLTPAFHFQILDNFIDVFNKQGRILCQQFDQKCNSGEMEPISIHPLITRCSLDIICGSFTFFILIS